MWRLATKLGIAAAAAIAVICCAAPAGAQVAGLPPLPIPGTSLTPLDEFQGAPWIPRPVTNASTPPRHPYMAPNDRSNLHNDAYMTDIYRGPGPLGNETEVRSNFFVRECGSIAFDSRDRLVSVCVGVDRPVLAMLEPVTLKVLATLPLPLRDPSSLTGIFTDFSGGGYFYLDNQDRAVLPTTDGHILVVAEAGTEAAPSFRIDADYDVNTAVNHTGGIVSVLPDWSGRLWFVTRGGNVGTLDPATGAVRSLALGEGISNSFSVDDSGGVFIVSERALYRFDAGPGGEPSVTWREQYANSGIHKPGQSDAGSGTTPTLMGTNWVAITDNDDPMNVVIYRRPGAIDPGLKREICRQPVFPKGAGNTDQSLIGTDSAVVVENNYGYTGPLSTQSGGTTTPGLARVDIYVTPHPGTQAADAKAKKKKKKKKRGKKKAREAKKKNGKKGKRKKRKKRPTVSTPGYYDVGCRLVWESGERAPSVVPKLSLDTGLVYTYTKPKNGSSDGWYFTALDFRTGDTVYKRLSGAGLGFNNNYAPVTLGPDGTAYVGVLGGLTSFRDEP